MPAKNIIRQALSSRWLDRLLPTMFVLALAVVCFIGGAYVAEFDVKLYQKVLQPSFRGLRAMREQHDSDWSQYGWYPVRDDRIGTCNYDPELAYDGLTLYTSLGDVPSASLISMTGEELHRWQLPFREAWTDTSHVPRAMPENHIHLRRVYLFPNGDLLANYTGIADSPNGYGLVKLDKDSSVIWRYSDRAHHDFDVDADGNIYTLAHAIRYKSVSRARHLRTPLIEDFVIVLSPEGKEIKRVAIFDAFARTRFRDYLQSIKSNSKGDHTHANSVALISEAFAKKRRFCSAGDVMISLRNPESLAILNLETEKIVWASRGIWERQHDADPLDNGNVLLFDNRGNHADGGRSRVLEWDPRSGTIRWSYSGTLKEPFQSMSRGCQQLLPNGNVLITESDQGRIFEVNRDRQIVWEFLNPVRSGEKNDRVAVVCSGVRYDPKDLTFLSPINMAHKMDKGSNTESPNARPTVR